MCLTVLIFTDFIAKNEFLTVVISKKKEKKLQRSLNKYYL